MFLIYQASKSLGKGKSQLFRRKSELPHDIVTMAALDKHKRNDFLNLNNNTNSNSTSSNSSSATGAVDSSSPAAPSTTTTTATSKT